MIPAKATQPTCSAPGAAADPGVACRESEAGKALFVDMALLESVSSESWTLTAMRTASILRIG
jgi:hypothetical protein